MTFTPSWLALSSFEPASAPARTKSVFLLTLELTLPPLSFIACSICWREKFSKRAGNDDGLARQGRAAFFLRMFGLNA